MNTGMFHCQMGNKFVEKQCGPSWILFIHASLGLVTFLDVDYPRVSMFYIPLLNRVVEINLLSPPKQTSFFYRNSI